MEVGHFYFLTPQYFEDFPNVHAMKNTSEERNRPCFCALKEDDLYWLVPISSQIKKFEKIYSDKIKRFNRCDTIAFAELLGIKKAFLIQNMCPVTEEYVRNEYLDQHSNPVRICEKREKSIISQAKKVLNLHHRGTTLIFGNVLTIEEQLQSRS